MKHFDYWHLRRYLSLVGIDPEEELPFGEPPVVIGSVVALPEPVWKTLVATLLAHGTNDVFQKWNRQHPLPISSAMTVLYLLPKIIHDVASSRTVSHPMELADDDQIDVDTTLRAMRALRDLIALAKERNTAISTWAE